MRKRKREQPPLKTIDDQLQEWIDDPSTPDFARQSFVNLLGAIHKNRERDAARKARESQAAATDGKAVADEA